MDIIHTSAKNYTEIEYYDIGRVAESLHEDKE